MQVRLRELDQKILDQLVAIEARNMLPFLEKIGVNLSSEDLALEIKKDPEQKIVMYLNKQGIVGFIRYKNEENIIFIKSIQMNALLKNNFSLKYLLLTGLHVLKEETCTYLESVVQTSNTKSIILHHKLGFQRLKEGSRAIRFSIKRDELLQKFAIQ